MLKKLKFGGNTAGQTCACSNSLGQNIWSKVKKSSKSGQNQKALISTFEYILTAIVKI